MTTMHRLARARMAGHHDLLSGNSSTIQIHGRHEAFAPSTPTEPLALSTLPSPHEEEKMHAKTVTSHKKEHQTGACSKVVT